MVAGAAEEKVTYASKASVVKRSEQEWGTCGGEQNTAEGTGESGEIIRKRKMEDKKDQQEEVGIVHGISTAAQIARTSRVQDGARNSIPTSDEAFSLLARTGSDSIML